MPLSVGVETLKVDLDTAYKKAKDDGSAAGADPDSIISNLAQDVADAIQAYMESAQVITSHIITPGQSAASSIPIASGPGVTVSPGSGTGPNGTVKFSSNSTLKSDLEAAYKKARDDGAADGADPAAVISTLAADVSLATHNFALTAIVETDITVAPGASVVGYLGPPPATAPVPAFTVGPGTGKGTGNLL